MEYRVRQIRGIKGSCCKHNRSCFSSCSTKRQHNTCQYPRHGHRKNNFIYLAEYAKNKKLHELDEAQRKELFKKFTEAGGKVITEKEKRRALIIDREKQRQHQQKLDEHYVRSKTQATSATTATKSAAKKSKGSEFPEDDAFNKFIIRMRLRFMRVTGFNTLFFHEKFLNSFSTVYKTSLMEIQMAYLTLFKKDPSIGNRIINRLDKMSSIYYSVIEIAGDIYEPMLLDEITSKYLEYQTIPIGVSELKDPIMSIFRPLFILKPFENTLLNAFEKAIDIYGNVSDPKSIKIKKRDIRNALFIIFDKLYPRLHTLLCHYYGILFSETDKRIEDILLIAPSEKPDGKTRYSRSSYQSSNIESPLENYQVAEEKEETEEYDSDIKEGLKLMYKFDYNTLRSIYDKKNRFEIITENDKTFLAYLLFLEFENEYSIILTTNQIKFNIDFSDHERVNYRESLQDLFNRMRKCHESFLAYYDSYSSYYKIKNSKPISNEQYITYTKRLDEVTKRKNEIGLNCRYTIRLYMENVSSLLSELIDDMNGRQKFINNPQDTLELFQEIEGDKKLKGKKIYEAIQICQRYAAALAYRLSPGGDLTGQSEFSEEKKYTDDTNKDTEPKEKNSILDELDDIL